MTLLLSVVLWLVDAWKFWQKAHMSHPPGVKWWWQSAWCFLELCVVHCEALWPSLCSPKLLVRYSFLFWKSRIWTGTYQVSKDALWKSGLFPTRMSHPCKVLQHATCMVWRERGYHVSAGRGWAKPQVHSLSFPLYRLCFAVCVCLTTQGIVRTCNDSRGLFVSGPLLCSSSTTGRSLRVCEVSVACFSQEEGTKRCQEAPPGIQQAWKQGKFEKPQNEVQGLERQLGRLMGFKSVCLFFGS